MVVGRAIDLNVACFWALSNNIAFTFKCRPLRDLSEQYTTNWNLCSMFKKSLPTSYCFRVFRVAYIHTCESFCGSNILCKLDLRGYIWSLFMVVIYVEMRVGQGLSIDNHTPNLANILQKDWKSSRTLLDSKFKFEKKKHFLSIKDYRLSMLHQNSVAIYKVFISFHSNDSHFRHVVKCSETCT